MDHWGGDSYREGLDQLALALDAEADLSPLGEAALEQQVLANLTNRLRVTAWSEEHPELLEPRGRTPHATLTSAALAPHPTARCSRPMDPRRRRDDLHGHGRRVGRAVRRPSR